MTFVFIVIYFSLLFYLIINIISICYSKESSAKRYREELVGLPPSIPRAVHDPSCTLPCHCSLVSMHLQTETHTHEALLLPLPSIMHITSQPVLLLDIPPTSPLFL